MVESVHQTAGTQRHGYNHANQRVFRYTSVAQQYGGYNRRFALYGLAGEMLIESNWMPPCGSGCETPPEGERARFVYFVGRKVFAAVSATPLGVQGPLKATTPNRLGSRADHYPYGEQKGAGPPDNDKDHFTTYRRDETGLDYAWNRYYSSTMGRFTTADPYGGSAVATMPESWNRYAYVGGNPVNRTDPSGLMWGFMSGGGYDWVACAMDPFGAMSTNWLTCGQSPWSEEMWSVLGPWGGSPEIHHGHVAISSPSARSRVGTRNPGGAQQFAPAGAVVVLAGPPVIFVITTTAVIIVGTYGAWELGTGFGRWISQRSKNRRENSQFADAVREYQRRCGRILSHDEIRRLHDWITGPEFNYADIIEEAIGLFGCPTTDGDTDDELQIERIGSSPRQGGRAR